MLKIGYVNLVKQVIKLAKLFIVVDLSEGQSPLLFVINFKTRFLRISKHLVFF